MPESPGVLSDTLREATSFLTRECHSARKREKGFRYWTDPYARREEAHQVLR